MLCCVRFDAVLFDMDGLMFDTERLSGQIFAQVSREYGMIIGPKEMALLRGRTYEAGRAAMAARFGPAVPYDEMMAKVWTELVRQVTLQKPLKPGLLELLRHCRQRGIRCAVATSTNQAIVEKYLADMGLAEWYEAVICGDMVERSKPEPDIYLAAARALGVPPARCLVLEDSYNGMRAGAAAGCAAVMVPDLDPPTAEMRDIAYWVVDSLLDVIPLLD